MFPENKIRVYKNLFHRTNTKKNVYRYNICGISIV